MIGFITDPETAAAIVKGIAAILDAHGQPNYWSTGSYPIYSGHYAGMAFIPASDELLATPLRKGLTPMDFQETHAMIDALGGRDARQDLDPQAIINPDQEI